MVEYNVTGSSTTQTKVVPASRLDFGCVCTGAASTNCSVCANYSSEVACQTASSSGCAWNASASVISVVPVGGFDVTQLEAGVATKAVMGAAASKLGRMFNRLSGGRWNTSGFTRVGSWKVTKEHCSKVSCDEYTLRHFGQKCILICAPTCAWN